MVGIASKAVANKSREGRLVDPTNFVKFVKLQLETGDYDAHIPMLRHLCTVHQLPLHERAWLAILYMAYYSEGSMWVAFNRKGVREREQLPPINLPITQQRRNLYGGRILKHFESWNGIERLGPWLLEADDWPQLMEKVGSIWGNGRWATFTSSELILEVTQARIDATTYEIVNSSGPRKGLMDLGLEPSEPEADWLRFWLLKQGVEVTHTQLESLLCDWHGMCKGNFYAGRNIDRQQGRLLDCEEFGRKRGIVVDLEAVWKARRFVYPKATLGEAVTVGALQRSKRKSTWQGIDKKRLKAYKNSKVVLKPYESR